MIKAFIYQDRFERTYQMDIKQNGRYEMMAHSDLRSCFEEIVDRGIRYEDLDLEIARDLEREANELAKEFGYA